MLKSLVAIIVPFTLLGCPADEAGEIVEQDTDTEDTQPQEDCQEVTFTEGTTGTYVVASGDDHVKHHFDMPEGITHMVASTTWVDGDWQIKMDVGEGTCPHSGTSHAFVSGTGGGLELELAAADIVGAETFVADDRWFVHLGLDMTEPPEEGATCDYTVKVQACKPADR